MTTGSRDASAPLDFAASFIDRLSKLATGDTAMLRRDAGRTLAEAKRGLMVFYRLFGSPKDDREEEIYFLVATLFPLNQRSCSGDFGRTMALLRDSGLSTDSADRRMTVLLDCRFDLVDGYKPGGGDLAYRLRQCVRLANSHEIGVDWLQLLRDLKWWQHPEKRVQKRWARSYFVKPVEIPGGATEDSREGE